MYETKIEIEKPNIIKNILKLITLLITSILLIIIIYALNSGILQDKDIFIQEINQFGITAPIIFILLQLTQIIIPIIPGGSSCLVGVLSFGPIYGFIYNYIGVVIGSILAYLLSKKYGLKVIQVFFKEETIQKYLNYISNNYFEKIFIIGIFFPILPDDLLCYIAGISKITLKKFLIIILVGKSISLLMYSFFFLIL